MSNNNNNQINIPEAREAMDRFKMQAAQEVGVNLQQGYNGHRLHFVWNCTTGTSAIINRS